MRYNLALKWFDIGFMVQMAIVMDNGQAQQIKALQEENARLRTELRRERYIHQVLLDCLPDSIYIKDVQSRFIMASATTARVMGAASADELIGKTDFDYYAAELAGDYYQIEQQILSDAAPLINHEELVFDHSIGQSAWYLTTKVPLYDEDGETIGLVGIGRDITQRKHAEQVAQSAMDKAENRFRSLVESLPQNIFTKDTDGRFTLVNPSYCRAMGKSADDLIGKTDFDLHPPHLAQKYRQDDAYVLERQDVLDIIEEHRLLNGDATYVQTIKAPLYDRHGKVSGVIGMFWDVTDRIQMEKALITSEKHNRALVEAIPDAILRVDATGQCLGSKPARNFDMPFAINTTTPQTIDDMLPSHIAIEISQQIDAVLSDGGSRTLEIELPVILLENLEENLGTTYDATRHYELIVTAKDDAEVLLLLRDIHDRKVAEQQRLDLVVAQERAQLLEEFISDVSHDLKTPITTINVSLYLLRQRFDPERQNQHFDQIDNQISRLKKLIQDFLTLSRLDKTTLVTLQTVDLNWLLKRVSDSMVSLAQRKQIQLKLETIPESVHVKADETNLERALVNLVENAITYTPDGGKVRLGLRTTPQQAIITIQDTGIGIAPDDLPHIFNRFYRADPARNTATGGTGLGLSIVKKIVELHHGRIDVQTELQKGSTFRLILPVAGAGAS